jgi:O26-antigen biosynthesis N-acetyl-L-fucosamine transferase
LLIVDDYLPHSTKVAAKMMHELALGLTRRGNFVAILTPSPYQTDNLLITKDNGIITLYFKSRKIKNISKIKRAIRETILSWVAWKASKKYFKNNRFDAIVYYSPSIFWGYLVIKLRSLFKCKSYLILRDIFPQWIVDNGIISKNSPVYWYFKFFEWVNYKSADKIGVMSQANLKYFQNTKKNASKFEVLCNWSEIPDNPASEIKYRKKLNLEDKIVLFYGGNIGYAQKIICLINLAKQFKDEPKVHFLFVGEGDEVDLILNEKEKHNMINVTYLPSVNPKTYYNLLNELDIGLISLHPDHMTHNCPGKILGYMGLSKPILGCVNKGNDLKEIINKSKAGFIVTSGDSDGLFQAAKSLVESESLRKKMGLNGRRLLSKQYSVESTCIQIEKSFKSG